MDAREDRVLYLAVADGRGHLMRAHLLRRVLADTGLTIDVVTTSPAGQAFLAGLGTPAALLPGGFALLFDDRHRLLARRTERHLAAYLTSPRGLARDVGRLARLAAGARFIVNDSCTLRRWPSRRRRRSRADRASSTSTATTCGARRCTTSTAARPTGRAARSAACSNPSTRARSGGSSTRWRPRIGSACATDRTDSACRRSRRPPRRARAEVRRALGLSGRDRLAAIY